MKILITTSGLGKRLGHLTKYTNKALVRVGNKFPICYIIEKYSNNNDFIITLGYYGKFVKNFLEIAYPKYKFTFIWVDKYEGVGSSLGYSLLQTEKNLQEPFIFHCCDCIYTDTINIEELKENTLFVSTTKNNNFNMANLFSSINVKGEDISKMNEKGEINYDFLYIGLSFIKDYKLFWNKLNKLYSQDTYKTSLSDIHVVKEMLKTNKFQYQIIEKWYDKLIKFFYTLKI